MERSEPLFYFFWSTWLICIIDLTLLSSESELPLKKNQMECDNCERQGSAEDQLNNEVEINESMDHLSLLSYCTDSKCFSSQFHNIAGSVPILRIIDEIKDEDTLKE